MPVPSGYIRISDLGIRCPRCGREGWCMIHNSGLQVICARVPSDDRRPGGWAHSCNAGPATPPDRTRKTRLTTFEVREYFDGTQCPLTDPLFANMAAVVKLSSESLRGMRAGYDTRRAVLTFPMFDDKLRIVGVRFRRRDGRKFSLRGGREGVFMSAVFEPDHPIVVTEGPTDAAALYELGFCNVLGLPNCCGGFGIIQNMLAQFTNTPVLIVSDPDPPGLAGAERLSATLVNPCMILTGETDIRDFVTKYHVRQTARSAIMEVVGGVERADLRVVGRNARGNGMNFRQLFSGV